MQDLAQQMKEAAVSRDVARVQELQGQLIGMKQGGGGEGGEKRSEAQAVVDRYPSGQTVIVYYDPRHPERGKGSRGRVLGSGTGGGDGPCGDGCQAQ